MWKCRNCETVNNGEVCVICGAKKPETDYRPEQEPVRGKESPPVRHYEVKKPESDRSRGGKKRILKVLLVCIAFVLVVFSLILAEEIVYHKAQSAANSGDYEEAIRCYSLIKFRSNVPARLKEAEYKQAEIEIDSGNYDKALEMLDKAGDYKDSAKLRLYLNVRKGYDGGDFHDALVNCENISGFRDTDVLKDQIIDDYYNACVRMYHNSEYSDALDGFFDLEKYKYKDTNKYMLLTQAHLKMLTDVSALYDMFYFEDTKDVVLMEKYIISFLAGRWSDAKGNYIEYNQKNGITCRTNIHNESGEWYIKNGIQYIKSGGREVKQWEIKANDFDEIEVYSFINNTRYILWRR